MKEQEEMKDLGGRLLLLISVEKALVLFLFCTETVWQFAREGNFLSLCGERCCREYYEQGCRIRASV